MPSVLFVCTANRFRSPISAALFSRRLYQEQLAQSWNVGSAGTWAEPDLPVIPSLKWFSENFRLDLTTHKARRINRELLAQYNLILVMEQNHQESLKVEFPDMKDKIFLLAEICTGVGYDVPDPVALNGDTFLDVAKELSDLIDKGFLNIYRQADR